MARNLKNAYANEPLNTLWPILIDNGVRKVRVRAVKSLYILYIKNSIKKGNRVSQRFTTSLSVSPTIFKSYSNSILKIIKSYMV